MAADPRPPAERPASPLAVWLRRLADWLESSSRSKSESGIRAQRREIELWIFALLLCGIFALGLAILGATWWLELLLFAVFFATGVLWLLRLAESVATLRDFSAGVVLLVAIPAATEYLLALLAALFVCSYLLVRLKSTWDFPRTFLSALLVVLFCFLSYQAFAGVLHWRRNAALRMAEAIAPHCQWEQKKAFVCTASKSAFSVPEFWQPAQHQHLASDMAAILPLISFMDAATGTRIAFTAFSVPPAAVMRQITDFFNLQQSYLKSKPIETKAILPRGILKTREAELYFVIYRSPELPHYLGSYQERQALLYLYQPLKEHSEGRETTWLFVLDAPELGAREFLLPRITTGFQRLP
ncbi:MAG: hypothetical protein N2Z22_10195 [Turneriella sp.]|nr:hypothetical protein [Turneriella sp.]